VSKRKKVEKTIAASPEPAGMEEKYYSVIETARLLKVVPETVRRRIRSRHLKAIRIGLGYRVAESEIERIKREGFPFKQSTA